MNKIIGIYKITNTITGDFYIGSSKNVKHRWENHKCKSTWKNHPNNPMYIDMHQYGVDKFEFQVLAEVEEGKLKDAEQQFIEALNPSYNNYYANGLNVERCKESHKKANRKYQKKYESQLCFYNGQTMTLGALGMRFWRKGIPNPIIEAKKYLSKR